MARKPDTPCASCGVLLWSGRGCLPAGQRLCRPCRRDPGRQRDLAAQRAARRSAARTDRAVAVKAAAPPRACACGAALAGRRQRCDVCLAQRRRAVWQRKNARRRGANPIGPLVSVAQLGARDGWRCHLCRRRVDAALPYQHAMAGTRDHLVPVTDGGDDSGANLRLAHRSCNSRRGVRGSVQLALVG